MHFGCAIGIGVVAQLLLSTPNSTPVAWALYAVASVGMLISSMAAGVAEADTSGSSAPPLGPALPSARRVLAAALALLVAGVCLCFLTLWLLWTHQRYEVTFWLWLVGITALAGSSLLARGQFAVVEPPKIGWRPSLELLAVLCILGIGMALRLPNLETVPPEVHGDEAAVGLEAQKLLHDKVPNLFGAGWYSLPYADFMWRSATMRVFGDDLVGLRVGSLTQGLLCVLLLYLVARRLFGARVALCAAFLVAAAQWHIHFSRSGIDYIQAQMATLLLIYLALRAFDTGQTVDYLLAGFAAGFCMDVYFAARLAPVIVALYVLHRMVTERSFFHRQALGLGLMAGGAVLFFAPTAVTFLQNPEAFMLRTRGVWLFTPGNLAHTMGASGLTEVPDILLLQVWHTLTAFNQTGESSGQFGHWGRPLLDFWSSILVAVGIVAASIRFWDSRYFLIGTWVWLTLIFGVILTIDAPFAPRMIGVIPPLMIVAALVIDIGYRYAVSLWGKGGSVAAAGLAVCLLVASLFANIDDYFLVHITQLQPAGFATTLARYGKSVNDQYHIVLIGARLVSLKYDTIRFLFPAVDGTDVADGPLPLPYPDIPASKGVAFVVQAGTEVYEPRLSELRDTYPRGVEETHRNTRGVVMFSSYLVSRGDLVARLTTTQAR